MVSPDGVAPSGMVSVSNVTGCIACCDVARRTVVRLIFGKECCSIVCDFDARQSRPSKMCDKSSGVTSV